MTKTKTTTTRELDVWARIDEDNRRRDRLDTAYTAITALVAVITVATMWVFIYFGYRPAMSHAASLDLAALGLLTGAVLGLLVALPFVIWVSRTLENN